MTKPRQLYSLCCARRFDDDVRDSVGPTLVGAGYVALSRARFLRTTPAGLRHVLIFDPRPIVARPQFLRIMVVVNSVVVDDDKGGYLVRYFTGGSLSDTPRQLSTSGDRLLQALDRFAVHYGSVVDPWLLGFQGPRDLVAALGAPELDLYRAQLLVQAGDVAAAKAEAEAYLSRIAVTSLTPEERRAAEQAVARVLGHA